MVISIMVVFGTRPEAIKMLPLVKALRANHSFRTSVLVTGQHREMIEQVFRVFGERPDLNLDVMTENQTLPQLTARLITETSRVIDEKKPDLVLVHGDTTTALAAGLSAFYARRRLGHVEAGLRSFDVTRPWPEEFNRVAVDAIADYLFAPTTVARDNLSAEANRRGKIYVTGNTGIDALLYVADRIKQNADLRHRLDRKYDFVDPTKHLILVTGHRRESFGGGIERICDALLELAERTDLTIVYPVHLNPNVRNAVGRRLGARSNIHLLDPVDYDEMVYLMLRSRLIITDSGGIQEEGPALGRPVIVMREVTERPEGLSEGAVRLTGTDPDRIVVQATEFLDGEAPELSPAFPYGDGSAAARIVAILEKELL
jgi:UDP-N-acetylglucosamine 2-epimerase (non-hydrolysing)